MRSLRRLPDAGGGCEQVTVRGIQTGRIMVSLESNLRGQITKEDFSDRHSHSDFNIRDFVNQGQVRKGSSLSPRVRTLIVRSASKIRCSRRCLLYAPS
jgi:hypothetical protein